MVEDDFKSADLIRLQLEAEGFTVLHADYRRGRAVLAAQQPLALITLDIMLPEHGRLGIPRAASSRCRRSGTSRS